MIMLKDNVRSGTETICKYVILPAFGVMTLAVIGAIVLSEAIIREI